MFRTKNLDILHLILGATLFLIGTFVVVALVNVRSQADSVTTQVTVTNEAPNVDSVYINEVGDSLHVTYTLTPSSGTTKTMYVVGTAYDSNGDGDITNISAALYRSGVAGGCAFDGTNDDENDCYSNTSCSTSLVDGNTQINYECAFTVQYFADSTDAGGTYPNENWTANVRATDAGALTGSNNSTTTEMNTLLSVTIPSSINYGTMAHNQSTTADNNQATEFVQQGNDIADVLVSSAAAMTCTQTGSIPIGNQRWSLTDVDYASGTTLSNTAADTNLAIQLRTGAITSKFLYWNILMPGSVAGTCTGTSTITATAS